MSEGSDFRVSERSEVGLSDGFDDGSIDGTYDGVSEGLEVGFLEG